MWINVWNCDGKQPNCRGLVRESLGHLPKEWWPNGTSHDNVLHLIN